MNARSLTRLLDRTGFILSPEGFRVQVLVADAKMEWGKVRVEALSTGRDGRPALRWIEADRVLVDTSEGVKSLMEVAAP